MDRIRLQKYFTDSGVMSRRKCEEAILDGRITVNSLPAELGMKVLPGVDRVFLDGREIVYTGAVRRTYIMLNKPAGVVSATSDNNDKTVIDILPGEYKRKGLFRPDHKRRPLLPEGGL